MANNQYQNMGEGQQYPVQPPAYSPQSNKSQNTPILIQPQQQQPIIIVPVAQPSTITYVRQPVASPPLAIVRDDPSCLWISACFGFFFPLIGLIMMAVFGCGKNLPPRQAQAYKTLVICTIIGIIWWVVVNLTVY